MNDDFHSCFVLLTKVNAFDYRRCRSVVALSNIDGKSLTGSFEIIVRASVIRKERRFTLKEDGEETKEKDNKIKGTSREEREKRK